ncbi:hypothetical protein [Mastigocladopsis repens]|uniref:hypothetical protein n=1 Tax=Mastigocladopsis repens TaxID=221287 RepID=UPI0002FD77D2|nr:hypothetical protein [Mastigocladopsis repens]
MLWKFIVSVLLLPSCLGFEIAAASLQKGVQTQSKSEEMGAQVAQIREDSSTQIDWETDPEQLKHHKYHHHKPRHHKPRRRYYRRHRAYPQGKRYHYRRRVQPRYIHYRKSLHRRNRYYHQRRYHPQYIHERHLYRNPYRYYRHGRYNH